MAKEGKKSFKKIIRNSLLRLASKEFLVFLFFLIISGLFWLALTFKDPMEREISIPFVITHVPKAIVITDTGTDTLKVTVRDDGYNVARLFYSDLAPVTAEFQKYAKSDGRIIISSAEVLKMVKQRLNSSTQVLSIKPERIEAYYNNGHYIKVPVEIHGKISAADDYFIIETKTTPDSVKVFSTAEILKGITTVKTEFVNLEDIKSQDEATVRLQSVSGAKIEPATVKVKAVADNIIEKHIEVPITSQGLPEGWTFIPFPKTVSVTFDAPSRLASDISASQFKVEAWYEDIEKDTLKQHLPLHVIAPANVRNVRVDPLWTDYLLEK